jgi:tRNA pseudouridine38-40 synthase
MKIKLLISYDGTDFEGWQKQNQGQKTIQGTIEDALSRLFNEPINIHGSGRTDTGVHAKAQVAHFLTPEGKDLKKLNIIRSLNSILPDSIAILRAWEAPHEFHSLHSAVKKTYKYQIHNSDVPDPLKIRYAVWYKRPLNIETMNSLCAPLIGVHDFKSFQTTGTQVATTIREILDLKWEIKGESQVEMSITGSGFLKQMVRNIVGTALYLERNLASCAEMSQEMARILAALDRSVAKNTAPAHGLYLHSVEYPPHLDNECREL